MAASAVSEQGVQLRRSSANKGASGARFHSERLLRTRLCPPPFPGEIKGAEVERSRPLSQAVPSVLSNFLLIDGGKGRGEPGHLITSPHLPHTKIKKGIKFCQLPNSLEVS